VLGHRGVDESLGRQEKKLMTFDQFAEAMSKSIFLSSEEEQKDQIKVFEMGDEDLEEEEC
jgi:hypothetical protein